MFGGIVCREMFQVMSIVQYLFDVFVACILLNELSSLVHGRIQGATVMPLPERLRQLFGPRAKSIGKVPKR